MGGIKNTHIVKSITTYVYSLLRFATEYYNGVIDIGLPRRCYFLSELKLFSPLVLCVCDLPAETTPASTHCFLGIYTIMNYM